MTAEEEDSHMAASLPTATISSIPAKRGRSALACEPCRRKKTKCDRNIPCQRCQRSDTDVCRYAVDDHVAKSPKLRATPLEHVSSLANVSFRSTSEDDSRINKSSSFPDASRSFQNPTVQDVSQSDGESIPIRGLFMKGRYFGPSHWMNDLSQFREVLKVIRATEAEQYLTEGGMVAKCKELAKVLKTRDLATSTYPTLSNYIPPKDVSDRLVQAYLRTSESVFRILHIPTFKQGYNDYWSNPDKANSSFIVQLLLVLAIGATFVPDESECLSLRATVASWISAVQIYIYTPPGKSRLNLCGLQTQCLLILARQMTSWGGDTVTITTGLLVKTAIQLGLHIDPTRFSDISTFEKEMRRRLWYTVLELDLQSSMDAGCRPMIANQDYDTKLPANIDDDQIDEHSQTVPVARPMDYFTSSLPQLMLACSVSLRSEIAQCINTFQTELTFEAMLILAAKLTPFLRSNAKLFEIMHSNRSISREFTTKLLDVLTQRFLLALHHPFAIQAKSCPQYYYSRKEALEIALSIVSPTLSPATSHAADVDDFKRSLSRGSGIFRNVPMQAVCTICFEAIAQAEEAQISFKPIASTVPFKEMRKTIEKYIDLASTRIRFGETNVKGYILFSCILAQIDALQAGTHVEAAITNSLWRSVDHCYRLLETCVNNAIKPSPNDMNNKSLPGSGHEMPPVITSLAMPPATLLPYADSSGRALGPPMMNSDSGQPWLLEGTGDFGFFYPLIDDL